jgi:hypothetical protein
LIEIGLEMTELYREIPITALSTKAITMNLPVGFFGTNSRIVAKFQTDRFRNFDANRAGKKSRGVNHIR